AQFEKLLHDKLHEMEHRTDDAHSTPNQFGGMPDIKQQLDDRDATFAAMQKGPGEANKKAIVALQAAQRTGILAQLEAHLFDLESTNARASPAATSISGSAKRSRFASA
ncbi:unnamed protein product, partial [Prorocentrum cordatum]